MAQVRSDICTPKGNPIIAYITPENSDSMRNFFDNYYANAYPNAVQIPTHDGFSSTRRYNCHGYAWHISEGGSDHWIGLGSPYDNDPEYGYWEDGSYVEIIGSVPYPGKVNWSSGDHSAITTEEPGILISKWNEYPLMKHAWDDSPFGTSNLKYYKLNIYITGPSTVCSSDNTFTINNLPPVNSIEWTCGPNLTISSGQNTASCTFSAYGTAISWVRATLVTSCGSITLPDKAVTAGITASFTGDDHILYQGSGSWTATASGCNPSYSYDWFLREDDGSGTGAVLVASGNPLTLWSVPRSSKAAARESVQSEGVNRQPPNSTIYYLSLRAGDPNMVFVTPEMRIVASGDVDLINPIARMEAAKNENVPALQLAISPNPASNEALLEISGSGERVLDANTEWQVEIYDSMQRLKTKAQKITGNERIINTSGWKNGVYIVRAIVNGEIISGKLIVSNN